MALAVDFLVDTWYTIDMEYQRDEHRVHLHQHRQESWLSGDGLRSYSPEDPANEALGYGCGADARAKPPDFSPGGL